MDFSGQTALITGASSGIGAEFAAQLHAAGASVVLVARRADRLEKSAAAFNSSRADSATVIAADLSDGLALRRVVQHIEANRVDILVNNAGRGSFGEFDTLDLDGELDLVAVNVLATLHLAHAVIPQMKKRRSGSIVSISSIAGFQPLPFMTTYAATKAFNVTHSLGLRYELAPYGVRVLTVCPGPVATDFGGVARVPGEMSDLPRNTAEEVVRESLRALGRRRTAFVVPCLRPKLMYLGTRLSPRALATRITGSILKSTLEAHRKLSGKGGEA